MRDEFKSEIPNPQSQIVSRGRKTIPARFLASLVSRAVCRMRADWMQIIRPFFEG
ncbi:MAG: hypothetical protein K1X72_00395 [Pyrinomonadaceae bacterium]|nr:hypothetical protein [Pyrinomonadaceae bacterium]